MIMPSQNSLADAGADFLPLSRLACERADDACVAWHDGRLLRWGDLRRDSTALMAKMRPGGSWVVASENAYALAVGLIAAIQRGGTAVLPANLQPGHLAMLGSSCDFIAADRVLPELPAPPVPLLGRAAAAPMPFVRADRSREAIVLHTSGSTGEPLAIRRNLRSVEAELAALEQAFGPDLNGRVIGTVPPYHIYGLLFRVLWPLCTGRVLLDTLLRYPEQLSSAVEATAPAILVSSPAFLSRSHPVLAFDRLRDKLTAIFSSGGVLPADAVAAFTGRLPAPLIDVYGSTETGGIAFRRSMGGCIAERWQLLPGVEVSVEADTGRLAVRSPHAAVDGWFRTGDIAAVHPDRSLSLGGRADRIVKIEERRVSLDEIERELAACIEVATVHVAVQTVGSPPRATVVAAIVPGPEGWRVLADKGKHAMTQLLRDRLRGRLDDLAIPRRWRFVRRLPRTDHGKITQGSIAALFGPDTGGADGPEILERRRETDGIEIRMRLPSELSWFRGHFDALPVLAGVVQVAWAIRFGRDAYGFGDRVARIEALKFFRIMPAGCEPVLRLHYDRAGRRLQFAYDGAGGRHSEGRILLAEAA